jgi:hypothetical protein
MEMESDFIKLHLDTGLNTTKELKAGCLVEFDSELQTELRMSPKNPYGLVTPGYNCRECLLYKMTDCLSYIDCKDREDPLSVIIAAVSVDERRRVK